MTIIIYSPPEPGSPYLVAFFEEGGKLVDTIQVGSWSEGEAIVAEYKRNVEADPQFRA